MILRTWQYPLPGNSTITSRNLEACIYQHGLAVNFGRMQCAGHASGRSRSVERKMADSAICWPAGDYLHVTCRRRMICLVFFVER